MSDPINRLFFKKDFFFQSMNSSPVGLNLCTEDGQWVYSNKSFLDMIGYSEEEANKLTYWQLTPQKYRAQEILQLDSLSKKGVYGPYRKEFIRKEGSLIPVLLNGFRIQLEDTEYIWSYIQDMTEFVQNEKNKQELDSKLSLASEMVSLGELAASIVHEIRNPLSIGIFHIEKIKKYCETIIEIQPSIEKVMDVFTRITKITDGLRNFGKTGTEAENTVFQTVEIVERAINFLDPFMKKLDINVILNHPEKDFEVFGCQYKLHQVMINLLNNAKDAMLDTKIKNLEVNVKDFNNEFVQISIKDSGTGMTPEVLQKLFSPFYTTKGAKGSGLGLGICQKIIHKMSGSLEITSEVNHGTLVTIKIPIFNK